VGDHSVDLQAFDAAQKADQGRNGQNRQEDSFLHTRASLPEAVEGFPAKKEWTAPIPWKPSGFSFTPES
jgi:hypothetical protein